MVDIIGDAIVALRIRTLNQVKRMLSRTQGESRARLAMELSGVISDGKVELESLGIKDPRVSAALRELEDIFVRIVRGEEIPELDNLPEPDEQSSKIRTMIIELKSDIDTAYIRLTEMARVTGNGDLFPE